MSRQFRYRLAALALSGLIFGAPLLTNGTASAGQNEPGGRRVTFAGSGMLGLSCNSKPSVESMTVPADSTIHVVNRTGHAARLKLGGATKGTVPDDGSAEVVFRRGTTAVLLTPDCAFGDEAVPVLVTAAPSESPALPDPAPAPSGPNASTLAAVPPASRTPSRLSAGGAAPDPSSAAARPADSLPNADRRVTGRPDEVRRSGAARAATGVAQAVPQGAGQVLKTDHLRSTAGVGVPAFAGMPVGDRKAMLPPASAGAGAVQAPVVPPTAEAAPAVPADGTTAAAAEPVAAMAPVPQSRPIGLLALIALVCALGVSAATIRAIVSQRAFRARLS